MSRISNLLNSRGETWTITPFNTNSNDEYNDPVIVKAKSVDFQAIRRDRLEESVLTIGGEKRTVDLEITIDAKTLHIDKVEDDTEISPIFADPHGQVYDGLALGRAGEKLMGSVVVYLKKRKGGR